MNRPGGLREPAGEDTGAATAVSGGRPLGVRTFDTHVHRETDEA
jgi:hypothetical protein